MSDQEQAERELLELLRGKDADEFIGPDRTESRPHLYLA